MAHPTRIFKKPEDLHKAWNEYKASRLEESKKWGKVQYVGKDGDRVEDYPMMPYSLAGFKVFCYDNYGNVEQYFVNQDGYYADFISICTRVKTEIRDNQLTGGMLGFFNSSITQRLNNLADKKEVTKRKERPIFGAKPKKEE